MDECRPQNECRPCPLVFQRVYVNCLVHGTSTIQWDLYPDFSDPQPHQFQLQVGGTGSNLADDWEDVGLPVIDSYLAFDAQQRLFGFRHNTHYRLKLTTAIGEYLSDPVGVLGSLDHRSWRLARETLRREKLAMRLMASEGYLLKARLGGIRCPRCADLATDEARDGNCPVCYGTGIKCGYFRPVPCVYASIEPTSAAQEKYEQGVTAANRGRIVQQPLVEEMDVWIDKGTDERYMIRDIRNVVEFRGVPLVAVARFESFPFNHIIYSIPMA